MQIARPQAAPEQISVPGPGPIEPQRSTQPHPPSTSDDTTMKPTPPIPRERSDDSDRLQDTGEGADADASRDTGDDDEDEPPRQANDPYSNLDSAFGGYLADAPRPMAGRRNQDDDDVLF